MRTITAPPSHAVLPPAAQLLHKIQKLTSKPFGHMELPQVARYTDSQRYVEHYDGVDPHTPAGKAFVASGGQRIATVLMYLNDVDDGGGTSFRRINVEIKPRKGHAVIFFPAFMNGELDPDALHAGMPPTGVKWVSQVDSAVAARGRPAVGGRADRGADAHRPAARGVRRPRRARGRDRLRDDDV